MRELFAALRINPALAIALSVFVASIAVLFASWFVVTFKPPSQVLGRYEEAEVLSTAAGNEGPAVLVGGTLQLGIDRCVNGNEIVRVEVTIAFRNLDTPPTPSVPYIEREVQQRLPGCNFALIPIPLPAKVTPGTWRVEGISRAVSTSELRYWASEEFRVVEQR